jgi:hypothetical protein
MHTTGNWQNSTLYPPVPQLAVLLDFQVSHYECILLKFLAIDITFKEQTFDFQIFGSVITVMRFGVV